MTSVVISKCKLTQDQIQDILDGLPIIGAAYMKRDVRQNTIEKLRKQLESIELYPNMVPMLKQDIIRQYHLSHVSPGENVGIIAGQSIGEKQTQMSLAYSEKVVVCRGRVATSAPIEHMAIGKLIDELMDQHSDHVITLEEDSWVLMPASIGHKAYSVYSVDSRGRCSWARVTCFSRHAPRGDLVEVTTTSGAKVVCTLSHSMLTRMHGVIVPLRASEVKVGVTVVPFIAGSGRDSVDDELWADVTWQRVTSVRVVDGREHKYVYDFSVEPTETFMLSNGMFVHNTLNSVVGTELIRYLDHNGTHRLATIGHFVDTCLNESSDKIQSIPDNRTEYLELDKPVYVLSVTEDGQVEWNAVTAVTRHDVDTSDLVKVETRLGHVVTATRRKSFFTRFNNRLVQKHTELAVGDIFPVVHKSPLPCGNGVQQVWKNCYDLDYDFGYMLAMFYMDGHADGHSRVVVNTTSIRSQDVVMRVCVQYLYKYVDYFNGVYIFSGQLSKHLSELQQDVIPEFMFSAPRECMRGFLHSIFADSGERVGVLALSMRKCIGELAAYFGLVVASVSSPSAISIVNKADYYRAILENTTPDYRQLDDRIPGVRLSLVGQDGVYTRTHLRAMLDACGVGMNILQKTVDQTVYYDVVTRVTPLATRGQGVMVKVYDLTVANAKTFALLGGPVVYDTFHTTGLTVKTVVSGVPRFMELMNTTKEPRSASCSVRVRASDRIRCIRDIRDTIGDKLRCVQLTRVMDDYEIVRFGDINSRGESWWLYDIEGVDPDERVLRVYLSHQLVYNYRCSLTAIVNRINTVFTDIRAVCSSLDECIVDIFVTGKDIVTLPTGPVAHITEDNKYDVFLEEIVLAKLAKFTVSGIDKIADYSISTVAPGKEWMVVTEGSNMRKLVELDLFGDNGESTINDVSSNNMWDIYAFLGIEAAREFLINEFVETISSDGTFINRCHVLLLVDAMTSRGTITSISRYSLRSKTSVLSRSSFEESIENFLKSGIFGEIDKMTSISANIMTGKMSHVGTGVCDVLFDNNVFERVDDHDDLATAQSQVETVVDAIQTRIFERPVVNARPLIGTG